MMNICFDCGFTKDCSEDEFAQHVFGHDDLDEILDELGLVQEQRQYKVTITPAGSED